MCIRSPLPGPHTSKRNKVHKVYPCLLNGVKVTRPNQVWQTDITYIPMRRAFMYLTAVIDVHTRFIVGWNLSNTMDAETCKQTIQESVENHGVPKIINTDQGSQYTCTVFTDYVFKLYQTKLSMDGKGKATDNAYLERFWRSIKNEHIYLNPTENVFELYHRIRQHTECYNNDLRQRNLSNQAPKTVYGLAA